MRKVINMSNKHEQDETVRNDLFPVPLEQGSAGLLPLSKREKWDAIHQIFYQGQNYYRVVDVIDALEVTKDPADYWSLMKRRMKKGEGFDETRQGMMQFELKSPRDRRLRKHDYATRQAILRLLQSVPSPKVEELRVWLAEVGEQRLKQEEIDRVEEKLEEAREYYRKQGMNERWIEDRILNLVGRNEITDQWRKRGAIEHLHFAKLTAIVHKGALGVTPDEHRQMKGLKRENPRDHMDRVELALLTLAEATTATKHIENDTQGVEGLEKDARETAKGSEQVREITEQSLGRPVVNPQNFLGQPKGKRKKQQLPAVEQGTLFEQEGTEPSSEE